MKFTILGLLFTFLVFIIALTFIYFYMFNLLLQNVRVGLLNMDPNLKIDPNSYHLFDDNHFSLLDNDNIDFEGFDNSKGANKPIVSNIVHLIYLNQSKLKFHQMINIFSIYLNTKPDCIYFHCDNCSFHGKYWLQLNELRELRQIIRIRRLDNVNARTIFGQEFGYVEHKSYVYRILVLMHYGGIYLDNDVFVVNSLDKYRRFEMTHKKNLIASFLVSSDGIKKSYVGNHVLIAHRNARFLRAYIEGYRLNYTSGSFYWNGGGYPALQIIQKNPELVNLVDKKLSARINLLGYFCKKNWNEWRTFDTIHVTLDRRNYLDKKNEIFDELKMNNGNCTYALLVRDIQKQIDNIK